MHANNCCCLQYYIKYLPEDNLNSNKNWLNDISLGEKMHWEIFCTKNAGVIFYFRPICPIKFLECNYNFIGCKRKLRQRDGTRPLVYHDRHEPMA